jgi:hypothetical protein
MCWCPHIEPHEPCLPYRSFDVWTGGCPAADYAGRPAWPQRRRSVIARSPRGRSSDGRFPPRGRPVHAITGAGRCPLTISRAGISYLGKKNGEPRRLLPVAFAAHGMTLPRSRLGAGAKERRHLNPLRPLPLVVDRAMLLTRSRSQPTACGVSVALVALDTCRRPAAQTGAGPVHLAAYCVLRTYRCQPLRSSLMASSVCLMTFGSVRQLAR